MDRLKHADGKHAVCGVGRVARVSAVFPHFGEEPCLTVRKVMLYYHVPFRLEHFSFGRLLDDVLAA